MVTNFMPVLKNRDSIFKRASALHQAGELTEADRLYRQVLSIDDAYIPALQMLAVIHEQMGNLAAVLEFIDKIILLRPDYAEAFFSRGIVQKNLSRFADAVDSYDSAIRLNPGYVEAFIDRGSTLRELGRHAEALDSYSEAIRLRPESAEAFFNRGNILQELGRFEEALASYRHAVRLKPNFIKAAMSMGILLDKLGRSDQAASIYQASVKIKASSVEEVRHIAAAYLKLGQWARAFETCPYPPSPPPNLHDGFSSVGESKKILDELPELRMIKHRSHRMRPSVLVAGDKKYRDRFFVRMRESLRQNSPGINMHLHAMLDINEKLDDLVNLLAEDTSLSWECYMPSVKAGFTARRFIRIPQLLDYLGQPMLLVDIDSEIVGDLTTFFESFRSFDVGIFYRRTETLISQLVAAGVTYVSASDGGMRFFHFLVNYFWHLEKEGKLEWFVDQMGLLAASEWASRNPGTVNLGSIPEYVTSWKDKSDRTLIVTFKGAKKFLEEHGAQNH